MIRKSWKIALAVVLSFGLLTLTALPATADKYPSKPIKIIVPLGAGGSHDLHSRAVASVLHQYIGQPAYVQLMPGGGGKIGMGALKRAKPDGYTLAMGANSHLYMSPHVKDMGFDPFKDFIPVFQINELPYMLATLGNQPWKNFKEYIAAAKKSKGKIKHGSTGTYGLSHTMMLKIAYDTKAPLPHVPFRGGGPAMKAMLGGHVQTAGANPATGGVLSNYKSGKIRILGVAAAKRFPLFPDVPTFREQGVDLLLSSKRIVMAPAGTPKDRIEILEKALLKVAKDKTFKRLLRKMGVKAEPVVGEKLLKEVRAEYESNKDIYKNAGVKIRN
ncbi:MAG: tripartite tricarboxylate transporter substrate binding protein [Nitrospinae bacterium]|nr:tripartite tricarboxylate transporter substrate binding protein [Nitrospinota bacterium]